MKQNAEWIVQCHSKDDHLVPVKEARIVAEKVNPLFIMSLFPFCIIRFLLFVIFMLICINITNICRRSEQSTMKWINMDTFNVTSSQKCWPSLNQN